MKKKYTNQSISLFGAVLFFPLAIQGFSQNILFSHDFETSNHGWGVADFGAGRSTSVNPSRISGGSFTGLSYTAISSRYALQRDFTYTLPEFGMLVTDPWEATGAHFFYQVAVDPNTTYRVTAQRLVNISYTASAASGFSVWDASSGIDVINPESNPRFTYQNFTNGAWQDIDLTFTTGASTSSILLTSGTYEANVYPDVPAGSDSWYLDLYNALGADAYRDLISNAGTYKLSDIISDRTGPDLYQETMTSSYALDNVTMQVVPEPSSALLLSLAGALSIMRRKRD